MLEQYNGMARALITLFIGLPLVWWLSNIICKSLKERLTPHLNMLLNKIIFYLGIGLIITSVLDNLGFSLSALLGAAGVAGIAIGFAAQTSISNIISGIFLVLERAFEVGDVISCNGVIGTVKSIDLFSIRLKTFDNKLVRVPNEYLINKAVTNITYFPIRRLDLTVRLATKENVQKVMQMLLLISQTKCNDCLKEPGPTIMLNSVNNTCIDLTLRLWTKTGNFFKVAREFMPIVQKSFEDEGITIWISKAN